MRLSARFWNFGRSWQSVAAALVVGALASSETFAQRAPLAPQHCPALGSNARTSLSWESDTGYEVAVRDLGGGKLRIVVVGDVLVLNKARFASLLRSVDQAPANVSELVLDAREVRIAEPLALQSAFVRIYAHTVVFEGRGLIALTRAPSAGADGLEINTHQLDLRKAQPIPLQVVMAQHGTPANEDPYRGRKVVIRAAELLTPQGPISGEEAARWLWKRSSNDDLYPAKAEVWSRWAVKIGRAGYEEAAQIGSTLVAWPGYTAFKLSKHFAVAPFDEENNAKLTQRIDELRTPFESLQQGDAWMRLQALQRLMQRGLDDRGYGPAQVPSEDFVAARDRFNAALDKAKPQLRQLRTLIVSAHATPKLDEAALKEVRQRVDSLEKDLAGRRASFGETVTTLDTLRAQGVEIDRRIVEEKEVSRQALERAHDKEKVLQDIRAATTVVAIGVSFIGTPALGAAIATTVSTAGDFVYAHNAGQAVNVETLITIGKKNAELYGQLKATREAWDIYSKDQQVLRDVRAGKKIIPKDAKKPLSKMDAVQQAGRSAIEFGKATKTVVDNLGAIPKPDAVALDQFQAGNVNLVAAMVQLATVQQGIGDATAKLKQLNDALDADETANASAHLTEQLLLDLKPGNDQEILRWKTAALQMWTRELQRLYANARSLRRSLYYETWKTPVLPETVATYPEEFTAYLAAGRYNPEAPGGITLAALTSAHLDAEIDKHLAVLGHTASAIDQAWQSYQAERAAGAQPFFDHQDLVNREGAPITTRLFLEHLNSQLRQQVDQPASRATTRFPLLVPFEMTSPLDPTLPERLLRAGVAHVRFKNDAAMIGKTLAFNISYRLAGELWRNGQCAYVDLSVPGGSGVAMRRDQATDPLGVVKVDAEQPLSFEKLRESRSAPPARTLYFVSVTVGGSPNDANWKHVPVIEGFTFWRRIVQ